MVSANLAIVLIALQVADLGNGSLNLVKRGKEDDLQGIPPQDLWIGFPPAKD
jgi:hypothetical protein